MENAESHASESPLIERRLQLVALSQRLWLEHSQLREASMLLRKESKELSEESKVLRTNGRLVEKIVELFCTHAVTTKTYKFESLAGRSLKDGWSGVKSSPGLMN